jgi:hypothetical protein
LGKISLANMIFLSHEEIPPLIRKI